MRRDYASLTLLAGLVALAAAPGFVLHAGRALEAGNLAGLGAALGCVLLAAWPVRPRTAPTAPPLALRRHRDLGLAALALATAHVAILLWREPLLIEHLLPTAPLYMAAGLVGLLALVYLVVAGLWPVRRRFAAPARFQVWHIGAALLLLVTVAAHALGAARYAGSTTAAGVLVLVTVLAVLVVLRARRHGRHPPRAGQGALARLAADSVCPRYAIRLVALVVLAAGLSVLCLLPGSTQALHRTPVARSTGIALAFPHDKHREVNCVLCHHNYVDHTGPSTCVVCHRSARRDLKMAIEPRFHAFCEGCHEQRTAADGKRGPIRSCTACHHGALPVIGANG